jgi:hypothetical protein
VSIAADPRAGSIQARYAWALEQHRLYGARLREDEATHEYPRHLVLSAAAETLLGLHPRQRTFQIDAENLVRQSYRELMLHRSAKMGTEEY